MSKEIILPDLGMDMDEALLITWTKNPGDTINKGDVIAEVETDKTTVEVESSPIYLRFPVVFDSEIVRETALRMLRDAGIGAGRMYPKTLASSFPDFADGVYPGAEHVAHCLLTLPTHHYVMDRDIDRMVDIIGSITESDAAMRGVAGITAG